MEKAFDKVDRNLLKLKILEYGIDGYMFKAIASLCNDSLCPICINGLMTRWFNAELGVRQGDCISPTMFALFINDMAKEIKELGRGFQYGETNVSIMLYVDDIVPLVEN
jgi:hypothetical protein